MTIINKLTEILHFTLQHLCILLAILAIMPSYLESANEAIAASTANGLADIYSGRTTKDGVSKHVVTKGNAALQATQDIFCTASRDVDAATLLEDAKGVMMDPKATRTDLKSALKSIETVQAFLLSSSKSLVTSAKSLRQCQPCYHITKKWRERGSPRQRKRPRKLVRRELRSNLNRCC